MRLKKNREKERIKDKVRERERGGEREREVEIKVKERRGVKTDSRGEKERKVRKLHSLLSVRIVRASPFNRHVPS